MRLHDYIRRDLVILDLEARDTREAIHALAERLREQNVVSDPDQLEEALLAREAAHTTAMGHGVAVPHATVEGLAEPVVLVAVAPGGIAFGPTGLDPVRVFFLLLSPTDRTSGHIKILARICRLVRHPGFIHRLERAESADAVLEEIERVDEAHV